MSNKHITHLGRIAVLPFDCYTNVKRPDGEYKDNLHKLYSQYYKCLFNQEEDKYEMCLQNILIEIKDRWKGGKMGRWRQDICGKRCNYSASSVLSPNPNLTLVQIGIPSEWKCQLTLLDKWNDTMYMTI